METIEEKSCICGCSGQSSVQYLDLEESFNQEQLCEHDQSRESRDGNATEEKRGGCGCGGHRSGEHQHAHGGCGCGGHSHGHDHDHGRGECGCGGHGHGHHHDGEHHAALHHGGKVFRQADGNLNLAVRGF